MADLLLADEQLFQPYTYFSVTLYLHFYVVNPTSSGTRISSQNKGRESSI